MKAPDLSEEALSAKIPAIVRLLQINRRIGRARVRLHKGLYWEVEIRTRGLKRNRHYRKSPTAAYRLAWQLTNEYNEHGTYAKTLTTAQRYEATAAFKLLETIGGNLLTVVSDHVKRHPLAGNARTLDDVRLELVAKKLKGNRRSRYVKDFDYKLRCLIAAIGNKAMSAITTNDLEDEIGRHDWAPGTVHSYVQSWKVIFNYAVKREYRLDNPCDKLELPEREEFEPAIFSVYDVRRMMALTLFSDIDPLLPACQGYLAIGTFAGIRPDEIDRLDWEQVDLASGVITITGASAKGRARRIVDISPNLKSWLLPIAKNSGPVLDYPVSKLRVTIRRAMGLAEWPHDVLRHSYGSYHFGHHRNEALVKNQMGHTDDGRIFFSSYRVVVSPKDAADFWGIHRPVGLLPQ